MKYVFRGKQQLNALKINRNAVLVTSGVLLFSVLGDEDGNHQMAKCKSMACCDVNSEVCKVAGDY